jgi:hypothetical protein
MWSSTTGALVEVEEALQNLCHHCQVVLTTSAGIASLQGDGVWWDASPLSESLLVSLLFALSHPESKAAHSMFGWITQEARYAAYLSMDRNRGGCPALSAALEKSAEHRESLLSEVGVFVSRELDTSLFAPVLSVPGGHLLLSDGARILGENVLLTNASYNPVSERGRVKMQVLPFSDVATVDLFGALSVAGLPVEEASQAALLLCK